MDRDLKNLLLAARRQAALDRAEFFARPGASPALWRGIGNVHKNRVRDAKRLACRATKRVDWQ